MMTALQTPCAAFTVTDTYFGNDLGSMWGNQTMVHPLFPFGGDNDKNVLVTPMDLSKLPDAHASEYDITEFTKNKYMVPRFIGGEMEMDVGVDPNTFGNDADSTALLGVDLSHIVREFCGLDQESVVKAVAFPMSGKGPFTSAAYEEVITETQVVALLTFGMKNDINIAHFGKFRFSSTWEIRNKRVPEGFECIVIRDGIMFTLTTVRVRVHVHEYKGSIVRYTLTAVEADYHLERNAFFKRSLNNIESLTDLLTEARKTCIDRYPQLASEYAWKPRVGSACKFFGIGTPAMEAECKRQEYARAERRKGNAKIRDENAQLRQRVEARLKRSRETLDILDKVIPITVGDYTRMHMNDDDHSVIEIDMSDSEEEEPVFKKPCAMIDLTRD